MKPFRLIKLNLNSKKFMQQLRVGIGIWFVIPYIILIIFYVTNSIVQKILIKKLDKPYKLVRKNFIDFHGNIKVFMKMVAH